MSHNPERKQKDCLNCGAVIYGRYCHLCGQENIEPKESFWHLVTHFVYDITHFDGKFFSTVKYLLLKPGFLPAEYIRGRRMNYLNPIKMYVFTSAFFFIFFFSVFKADEMNSENKKKLSYANTLHEIEVKKAEVNTALKQQGLPAHIMQQLERQNAYLNSDLERLKADTTHLEDLNYYKQESLDEDLGISTNLIDLNADANKSRAEYDSIQAGLPANKKDGWLARRYKYKKLELVEKFGSDRKEAFRTLLDKFFHSFPQILFVSLPIFALLLKLLYVRRKNLYYADHAIFSVHLYCAMFIFIFIQMVLSRLEDHLDWLSYLILAFFGYITWYNYKALRNFYQQSRKKTIFKFFLLLLLSGFVMTLLFIAFFIFSLFTI